MSRDGRPDKGKEKGKASGTAGPKTIVPTGLSKATKKVGEKGKAASTRRPPQRGFSLLNTSGENSLTTRDGGTGGAASRLGGGNFNLLDKTAGAGSKGLGSLDKISGGGLGGIGGLGGLGLLRGGGGIAGAVKSGGIGRSRVFGSAASAGKK